MKIGKFKIFYGICIGLIVIYAFYSYFTGTGLSGWLIKLQFDLFGQAIDKLTILLAIAILMTPLEIARYFLRKKGVVDEADDAPFDAKNWVKSLSLPSLAALVLVFLMPAAAGYGIYSYLYAQNQEKLKEKIYDVDLNADPVISENEHYVRLHGKLQENITYTVEQGRSSSGGTQNENYVPLTAEDWDGTEPVRFIYYSKGYLPPNVTGKFKAAPKSDYDGQIVPMELPVYVRSEYEKNGLKIAAPYYMVQTEIFFDGKIQDRFYNSNAMLFLIGGIIFSVIAVFLTFIYKVQPNTDKS